MCGSCLDQSISGLSKDLLPNHLSSASCNYSSGIDESNKNVHFLFLLLFIFLPLFRQTKRSTERNWLRHTHTNEWMSCSQQDKLNQDWCVRNFEILWRNQRDFSSEETIFCSKTHLFLFSVWVEMFLSNILQNKSVHGYMNVLRSRLDFMSTWRRCIMVKHFLIDLRYVKILISPYVYCYFLSYIWVYIIE